MFGSPPLEGALNTVGSGLDALVLPDTHDPPSRGLKGRIGETVSLDVAAELRRPVPLVASRPPAMHRAHMPEAPMNKDGNTSAREDEVGADAPAREVDPEVLPKAPSSSVQLGTERPLRLRVGPVDRGEVAPTATRRGDRRPAVGCGIGHPITVRRRRAAVDAGFGTIVRAEPGTTARAHHRAQGASHRVV